jgi:hypothetical protein
MALNTSKKYQTILAGNLRKFPPFFRWSISQISAIVLNCLWGLNLKWIVAVTGVPWVIYGIQSGWQEANASSTQVCLHNEPWYTYRVQV